MADELEEEEEEEKDDDEIGVEASAAAELSAAARGELLGDATLGDALGDAAGANDSAGERSALCSSARDGIVSVVFSPKRTLRLRTELRIRVGVAGLCAALEAAATGSLSSCSATAAMMAKARAFCASSSSSSASMWCLGDACFGDLALGDGCALGETIEPALWRAAEAEDDEDEDGVSTAPALWRRESS